MLTETLSQYSALMVMEHLYGRDQMRRFLKFELDGYLKSRGGEAIEELPLDRVEDQPDIHYRKGSLVMYRLKNELGEARVNAAHKRYADGRGTETEAPMHGRAEIGAFAAMPGRGKFAAKDVLGIRRIPIRSGVQTVRLVSATRPGFAGVDP